MRLTGRSLCRTVPCPTVGCNQMAPVHVIALFSKADVAFAFLSVQVSARRTPTWIPHASANRPKSEQGDGRSATSNSRNGTGAERLQTISDSQRKFAARFSHSAAERGLDLPPDARGSGAGSRWVSRPAPRPQLPSSPDSSRDNEAKIRAAGAHYRAHVNGGEDGEQNGRAEEGDEYLARDLGGGQEDEPDSYRGRASTPGKNGVSTCSVLHHSGNGPVEVRDEQPCVKRCHCAQRDHLTAALTGTRTFQQISLFFGRCVRFFTLAEWSCEGPMDERGRPEDY